MSEKENEKKQTIKEKILGAKEQAKEYEPQIEEIEAMSKDLGYDIGYDQDFARQTPKKEGLPKVELTRPSTVGDGIRAELMARRHFGIGVDEPVPDFALMLAKISMLVKFDGKLLPLPEIEKIDPDFLFQLSLVYARHLAA